MAFMMRKALSAPLSYVLMKRKESATGALFGPLTE